MFGKKIDTKKINEVATLSAKVLKVLYLLLIALALYIVVILFKETKILVFLKSIIKIISPLFMGLTIAWLFDPFVKILERKNVKRPLGALITYALLFSIIFLILSALIPLLVNEIKEFINMAPSIFEDLKNWGNSFINHIGKSGLVDAAKTKTQFANGITKMASNITVAMPHNLLAIATKIFSWLGNIIVGLIIGFFLIVNFDDSNKLFKFIPKKYRKNTINILDKINISLRSYVKGAAIDCTIIFVLSSLGLWMIGLKVPALFGLFCALTNIIPYAGPYIGGAPAVIVGFTQSQTVGILTLLVIFVIQFIEGNFLQPLIMSKTTKLHPVTIIIGLLIFGYFFGIIGMLISTPLIATIKIIIKYFNEKYDIIKKEETGHE